MLIGYGYSIPSNLVLKGGFLSVWTSFIKRADADGAIQDYVPYCLYQRFARIYTLELN